jgi:hypothetical protein
MLPIEFCVKKKGKETDGVPDKLYKGKKSWNATEN